MVSPYLQRKSQTALHVSGHAKDLFRAVYKQQTQADEAGDNVPKIRVSDLISKMAFYYEKIRNSVDYNEEYLLRKNAIARILKRQIVIEGIIKASKSEEVSKNLLVELIRAGYLPNNKIPEEKIGEVGKVIEKYIQLRNHVLSQFGHSLFNLKNDNGEDKKSREERNELNNWIISLAASEIEAILGRDKVKDTVVINLYEYLTKNIQLEDDTAYGKDLDIQIYLGIHRNYLKFDEDMLSLILFKYFNSKWRDPSEEDIKEIAQNISQLREAINKQLNHPLSRQLDKVISRYNVFLTILVDVIREDPVSIYNTIKNDSNKFQELVKKAFNKKYQSRKKKLWRAAVRSIIYIFLTKSIFVILLEIPATQFFGQEVSPFSLAINVGFPPFLLFLAVFFTRISSDQNTRKVIEGVEEITFQEKQRTESILLRKPAKRRSVMSAIFNIFYTITFFVTFGLVVWALTLINFNWVSIIIFLFFLAFVSFFAIRIRKTTKEFLVVEPRENIVTFLLDFFSIPIIAVGKWLSQKFSRINVFVFFLDFIIEAPFKVFVQIAEEWTRYVRERKEDIV